MSPVPVPAPSLPVERRKPQENVLPSKRGTVEVDAVSIRHTVSQLPGLSQTAAKGSERDMKNACNIGVTFFKKVVILELFTVVYIYGKEYELSYY